jgi:hypothetical protein
MYKCKKLLFFPKRKSPKKFIPRYIIVKTKSHRKLKAKKKILFREAREKWYITCKRKTI